MTVLLILASLAAPTSAAQHPRPCHTNACELRVARKQCDRGDVRACIRRGGLQHHVSVPYLTKVAWCESRLDPTQVNGRYVGLFQFGKPLWNHLRYRHHSRFSAKWSSLAAALAFHEGLSRHWSCA